jgi:hypothetical protein
MAPEMAPLESSLSSRLRDARWGLVLSLLTILFGFGLGGAFGAAEDSLKQRLRDGASGAKDTIYAGDEAKMNAVVDKSWAYLKRAHLHGGAIGAVALGATLLTAALRRPGRRTRAGVSLALGAGGLGYALFWLLAGFSAPSLGGTGPAKDAFEWLAVPSAGLLLLGILAVLVLTVRDLFTDPL